MLLNKETSKIKYIDFHFSESHTQFNEFIQIVDLGSFGPRGTTYRDNKHNDCKNDDKKVDNSKDLIDVAKEDVPLSNGVITGGFGGDSSLDCMEDTSKTRTSFNWALLIALLVLIATIIIIVMAKKQNEEKEFND